MEKNPKTRKSARKYFHLPSSNIWATQDVLMKWSTVLYFLKRPCGSFYECCAKCISVFLRRLPNARGSYLDMNAKPCFFGISFILVVSIVWINISFLFRNLSTIAESTKSIKTSACKRLKMASALLGVYESIFWISGDKYFSTRSRTSLFSWLKTFSRPLVCYVQNKHQHVQSWFVRECVIITQLSPTENLG